MHDLPVSIIRSKLYPPPMVSDTVKRERLLSLAQSVAQSPLTLVSAPAGYGKSTLVSQWLDSLGCKSAWLSLDAADSNFIQFLSYVVAALNGAYPGCCAETAQYLQSAALPGPNELAGVFCNDIEELEEPIALVLDDYYQISSSEIDDFLDIVLKHPPQNLHLIIISRRDPTLSISTLRARGKLCEVRMQQLEFREDETRAFIRVHLDDQITDDDIKLLHKRTEGWPAALRLARLASAEGGSTSSVVDQLPNDSHAVRTYLIQEVLANQTTEIREYLLRASFLDRFCPELCEAIMPEDSADISGEEFVNHVNKTNLFSIALDASGNWFRLHHLFQAMLQDQALIDLGDQAIRDIHVRASAWFEEHELVSEAIRHALSADRADKAAGVINRHRNIIMNRERWPQLLTWLGLLPRQIVESRPELQVLYARIYRTTGQDVKLVEALDNAESLLASGVEYEHKNELLGSLASVRCFQRYMQSDGQGAIRVARRALDLLSKDDLAERGFAMLILTLGMQMTGDVKGAKSVVYSAMTDQSTQGEFGATFTTRLFNTLCFFHWMDADLKNLYLAATDSTNLGTQSELWEVVSGAVHFQAATHYHQNDLSAVERDLQDFLRRKAIANTEFYSLNLIISALAHDALDNSVEVEKNVKSLHEIAFGTHNSYLIGLSGALAAELAIRQGRMAEALKWADQYDPEPFVPMYSFFSPTMCLAKILVLDDGAASHERAQALLPKLEDYLAGIHNKRFLIETLALRALLSDKTGDAVLAVEQLGRAISLAQPGGFIRLFVDLGSGLLPLLNRLELRGEKLQYVGRILAAFQSEGGQADASQTGTRVAVSINDIAGLPESLSPREKEVLALLVERLTNKDIGAQLFISTATVKRHAHSIYENLNV
ncbi:MAG: LuxR C-terminal-related transcriptional regulator [Woeseiaceae bacterium]|nr:LuxR C-terminal-related transcriptional regulator [Woeseiaceae bacterium]